MTATFPAFVGLQGVFESQIIMGFIATLKSVTEISTVEIS
jgi:hypothetical protein